VTLEEYAETWLATRRVRGRPLAPRTTALYLWQLRRHVLPWLGSTPLTELSRAQVRAWHQTLCDGPGVMTAAKCYRLLRAMLASAVEQELLAASPCTLKGAGDEWSPERPVVTVGQVFALADEVGERWRAAVLLAVFCGLRFGELSALRRCDVDLRAGTVTVRATAGEALGTGRVVGPPKSAAGRRVLTVPDAIRPDLRLHLARFAAPGEQGLVFVGPRGGPLQSANFGRAVWRPARERAGLPALHFHDLRHTGNTLAAATGASLAELMARMGHASTDAALRYQHATRARDAALADALSELATQARDESRRTSPDEAVGA
jgi:integrase